MFDKSFKGTLHAQGLSVGVQFRLVLREDGELDVRFRRRSITRNVWSLHRLWHPGEEDRAEFSLRGVATDGTSFETNDLQLKSFGKVLSGVGKPHTFKPVVECYRGYIRMGLDRPAERPVLQWRLKGFECFPALTAQCPLGRIRMGGETRMETAGPVNGLLTLEAGGDPGDVEDWRRRADALFEYIRRVMSFASSTMLGAPIAEFWNGDRLEVELLSETPQRAPEMRVFPSLNLQPVLDAAIASHFDPLFPVHNLFYAIEWFAMTSSYDEVRLVSAMTALENLIDSNLDEGDALILPTKPFEKARRTLRGVIRQCLSGTSDVQLGDGLVELNEKLGDLNRRPLRQKLMRLADQWEVALEGISDADIKGAIAARNMVVHRGHNAARTGDRDLWRHLTVVREIVVRFLLTAIGFRGDYISHMGGYHFAKYPPVAADSEVVDETERHG